MDFEATSPAFELCSVIYCKFELGLRASSSSPHLYVTWELRQLTSSLWRLDQTQVKTHV